MEKSFLDTAVRKHYKRLIAVAAAFVLIAGIMGVFSNDEGVNEMFLSGGSMYYTNYKDKLYRYDPLSGTGKVVSTLNIRNATQVFEDQGTIYYSNGSTISRKSLGDGSTERLIKGENISVVAVSGSSLVYASAQRDVNGKGFSEFEYRMYDLATGTDTELLKRSNDYWKFLDSDEKTVIAEAKVQGDFGLYSLDLATGLKKKLISTNPGGGALLREVVRGYIANEKFYFITQPGTGLLSMDLNGDHLDSIPLPGSDQENFGVSRITSFGDSLYVSTHYGGEGYIIRMDLKTRETTIVANGFGAIWELCADEKALYVYDMKSPADKKGTITVIPLE